MSKEKIPANAIAVNTADRLQYDRRTDPVFFLCLHKHMKRQNVDVSLTLSGKL